MKTEYREGKDARNDFERTMTALFRVSKSAVKDKPTPKPKKKAGKD